MQVDLITEGGGIEVSAVGAVQSAGGDLAADGPGAVRLGGVDGVVALDLNGGDGVAEVQIGGGIGKDIVTGSTGIQVHVGHLIGCDLFAVIREGVGRSRVLDIIGEEDTGDGLGRVRGGLVAHVDILGRSTTALIQVVVNKRIAGVFHGVLCGTLIFVGRKVDPTDISGHACRLGLHRGQGRHQAQHQAQAQGQAKGFFP